MTLHRRETHRLKVKLSEFAGLYNVNDRTTSAFVFVNKLESTAALSQNKFVLSERKSL